MNETVEEVMARLAPAAMKEFNNMPEREKFLMQVRVDQETAQFAEALRLSNLEEYWKIKDIPITGIEKRDYN